MKKSFINGWTKHFRLLLIVIPILYLFLGFYFNRLSGTYYVRSVDSEYIYFISGLSLARGHFLIGHIDNPATPLQYVVALSFKATHLIRQPESGIIDDAILHSELYLKIANLVLLTLTSLFLLAAGAFVFRLTKQVTLAFLVQSAPFISQLSLDNLSRFAPEAFLILPVVMMMCFILWVLDHEDPDVRKPAILAGLIAGFGLSVKLTFFPLWLLPLFVLKKRHILYLATAIFSFFLMALPVTLQISRFWHWIKRLLFFSGQHGEGEKSFIDWNTFGPNITEIYNSNKFYFHVLAIFAVIFTIRIILNRKDRPLLKLGAGVLAVIALLLFMVGKHFEYRYFIMALYLFPLILLLSVKMVLPGQWKFHKTISGLVYFFTAVFLLYTQLALIPVKTMHISRDVDNKYKTLQFASTLPAGANRIIASSYYGGAFVEYAMMFTGAYAGKQKETYARHFATLYPNSWIYHSWDRSMNSWGTSPEINENSAPFYVYLHSQTIGEQLFEDLGKIASPGIGFVTDTLYHNDYSDETILKVTVTQPNQTYLKNLDQENGGSHHMTGS